MVIDDLSLPLHRRRPYKASAFCKVRVSKTTAKQAKSWNFLAGRIEGRGCNMMTGSETLDVRIVCFPAVVGNMTWLRSLDDCRQGALLLLSYARISYGVVDSGNSCSNNAKISHTLPP